MFTLNYRSFYIQGYLDDRPCYVMFGGDKRTFISVLAAKQFITRRLHIAYGYSTMSAANRRLFGFK